MASVAAGVVTGLLGITGWKGFLMYVLFHGLVLDGTPPSERQMCDKCDCCIGFRNGHNEDWISCSEVLRCLEGATNVDGLHIKWHSILPPLLDYLL